jgi:hypothetical protein
VLATASAEGRLHEALPAVGRYLLARPSAARAEAVRDLMSAADPRDPEQRALADLVAVAHGGAVEHADLDAPGTYLRHLIDELDPIRPIATQVRHVSQFVRSLLAGGDPVTDGRVGLGFVLATDLGAADSRNAALQELARAAESRRIRFSALSADQRERLLHLSPALRQRTSAEDLTEAAPAADDHDLARLLAGTIADGVPPELAAESLRRWPGRTDPDRVTGLLARTMARFGPPRESWWRRYVHVFVHTLLRAEPGSEAVYRWRVWASYEAAPQQLMVGLLRDSVLMAPPRPRTAHPWLQAVRNRLRWTVKQ